MSAPSLAQLEALARLWRTAQNDTGGSRVCVGLLLGLYNGPRFPFDLTEMRCLDDTHLRAALVVLAMDASPQAEVHVLLERHLGLRNVGLRLELLAHDWLLQGRCPADVVDDIRARVAASTGEPA